MNLPYRILVGFLLCSGWSAYSQVLERQSPSCAPEAIEKARDGADREEPAALYLMARYYATGKCIPGDGKKGIDFYLRAAKLNYPPAFYNLGIVSAGNQDFQSAEAFFARGAQLGHRGSEYQLGILYSLVPPPVGDDVKAFAWLSLTASRPEPVAEEAEDRLRTVKRRMNQEALTRGEVLYQQLRERYASVSAFSN
jgi:TPR repeat protein